eukprot:m.106206 g.106206  ORF g.106206 m.106206 type:complete len:267 (-) comp8941_c0_seq1:618-1418(-)
MVMIGDVRVQPEPTHCLLYLGDFAEAYAPKSSVCEDIVLRDLGPLELCPSVCVMAREKPIGAVRFPYASYERLLELPVQHMELASRSAGNILMRACYLALVALPVSRYDCLVNTLWTHRLTVADIFGLKLSANDQQARCYFPAVMAGFAGREYELLRELVDSDRHATTAMTIWRGNSGAVKFFQSFICYACHSFFNAAIDGYLRPARREGLTPGAIADGIVSNIVASAVRPHGAADCSPACRCWPCSRRSRAAWASPTASRRTARK